MPSPFDGQQMDGVHLPRASMKNTNFDGVNLEGARFYAVMCRASFTDCNLVEASWNDVNMSDCVVQNANMAAMRFHDVNLSGAQISNANLEGLRISGVSLRHASIIDADMEGMTINGIPVSELLALHTAAQGQE
ncbi:Pentapeptide repeat-containing protein [Monaibacterium marinum]|uniref:Pentapeptide repeat-containing protein n=1 Tax=Pontivivens marinum TaxID=1690039 RepID=A0A2C9CS25_9RHOB|nr:pentapeptide repeat-containing protein [Monaibacterium marinum]SOH94144.1 Pentapeptide repeat-containing protein [Monaibacterium marinum]